MSELQPLLSSTRRRTSTDYTELLPDRHGLAPRFFCFEPCASPSTSSSRRALLRTCGATRASPWLQRRALLAWPGLAWPCLSLAPPCPYCTQRARDLARRQGLQLEAAAFRHVVGATMIRQRLVIFVTGRFSRPFLGNWEPTTLSLLRLHLLRTSLMNMTTTAMNFTCLLIYYFYSPFTSLGRPFSQSPTRYQSSLHPCMHCRLFSFFFFFFLLGPQRQDGYR